MKLSIAFLLSRLQYILCYAKTDFPDKETSSEEKPTEFVSETLNEEKLVELWPEYPCPYDVRLGGFNDRQTIESHFRDRWKGHAEW